MTEVKTTRIGARSLFVGAAAVIVLAGLKAAQTLVIPFLLALFLAIICSPAVSWLTRRRVPAALAVLVVVIVLMALGFFLVAHLPVPPGLARHQAARFLNESPRAT